MPNISADYPMLQDWLSSIIMLLIELKALKLADLILCDKINDKTVTEEDDVPMVEDYFRLVSKILLQLSME